ncbi:unnamed protein product [Symbiodinium necroappetens]|uniref:Uncharacterized protein n=1 Tax=Symbiodinium necroappetens TaxID=1628268 RepID=A0A813CEM0_9DINO|nr:unnamed protein product [Symbiodinium necroappetens]
MLAFTFRNTDGSSDMLCGSPEPSCFIEKIQLFANGQRVEEISYYGRSCFMYSLLKREEGPPVGGPPRGRQRLGPARPARAEAGHAHGATFDRYVRRGQDAPAAAQSGRTVSCYFVTGKNVARCFFTTVPGKLVLSDEELKAFNAVRKELKKKANKDKKTADNATLTTLRSILIVNFKKDFPSEKQLKKMSFNYTDKIMKIMRGDIIQVSVLGQGGGARGFNIKKLIGKTTGTREMKEDDQEFFNSVFKDVKQVLGSEQVNFKLLAYFTHDRSHLDNKLYRAGEFTDVLTRFDKLATMLDDTNPHMKQLVFASIVKSSGQVKTADIQKDVEVHIDVLPW